MSVRSPEASASIRMTVIGIIVVSCFRCWAFLLCQSSRRSDLPDHDWLDGNLHQATSARRSKSSTRSDRDQGDGPRRAGFQRQRRAHRPTRGRRRTSKQCRKTSGEPLASEIGLVLRKWRKQRTAFADGLKHLASSDLSFQLTARFADDFETLRADFNRAVEQLRSTLTSVAGATRVLSSGSREISQSADDLSKRTELGRPLRWRRLCRRP